MFAFYFSHDGNWCEGGRSINWYNSDGIIQKITKVMCWEKCAENTECVAFAYYWEDTILGRWGRCTHYYDKTELLSGTERYGKHWKAFIKCSSIMIIQYIFFPVSFYSCDEMFCLKSQCFSLLYKSM